MEEQGRVIVYENMTNRVVLDDLPRRHSTNLEQQTLEKRYTMASLRERRSGSKPATVCLN